MHISFFGHPLVGWWGGGGGNGGGLVYQILAQRENRGLCVKKIRPILQGSHGLENSLNFRGSP